MKCWWMNIERGKANYSLKNVHNNCSVDRKFNMLTLGLKSGLHHETPRNKCLSHGMRKYGIGFILSGIRS